LLKRFTIISVIAAVLVVPALVFGANGKIAPAKAVVTENTVTVPLEISNQDGLTAVDMALRYSEGVTLQEVSFAGTRVEYFDMKLFHNDAANRTLIIGLINQATPERKPELAAGEGPVANLVFTVDNPSITNVTLEAVTTTNPSHSMLFVYRDIQGGTTQFRKEEPRFDQVSVALSGGAATGLPTEYALGQNYPNPFNPSTNISFALPKAGNVEVSVYNVLGQQVNTIVSGELPAGNHTVVWDGRNTGGDAVSSGIYFYRIVAGDFSQTKKMLMLK
jgi:hypothetical protein